MSLFMKFMRNLPYPKYRRNVLTCNLVNRLQNSSKNLHCSPQLSAKMYMEHENKYAYSILENKGYAISINTTAQNQTLSEEQFEDLLRTDWSKTPHTEMIEIFSKFGTYCSENSLCISNNIFDTFIDHLTDCLKRATDKELESVFYALNKWPETPSIRTRNYIEIWAALDDECQNRYKSWSHDELLSFVALFYMLNVTRHSDFTLKSLNKLASKAKQLNPGQLVQTLFFVGIQRKSPFDMHNLEIGLINQFNEFTVDDLAIMAMGFFKSKTPIRDMDLVLKIINTVILNSKTIHEVSLAALLKLIRYSTKLCVDDRIQRLLDTLQHEVHRLSIMCNVHIALVGTSTLNFHEQCLTKIAECVNDSMSKTRLKDLERLVLTYGTFNMIPKTKPCFFTNVMEELRKPERNAEIYSHGRSFTCCVSYLGLLGFYPIDLIQKVFSPDFLEATYGKNFFNYGREILTLNNLAEIFCPDAKINCLTEKQVKVMAKKFTDYVPSEDYVKQYNVTERMVLDVMKILKEYRGGNDYVIGEHILSHHQRGDLVICNDHSGAPLPVKEKFPSNDFGLIRQPPDNNIWTVLVIAGRNAILQGTDIPTGFFTCKIRELETLGYNAALVPWSIYSKLETAGDKANYLNNLIEQCWKQKLRNKAH